MNSFVFKQDELLKQVEELPPATPTPQPATHQHQLAFIAVVLLLDVGGLVLLRWWKRWQGGTLPGASTWKFGSKALLYRSYIACSIAVAAYFDVYYPISTFWLNIKTYSLVFMIGLADYWFSDVESVDLRVIPGAMIYCSVSIFTDWCNARFIGTSVDIVTSLGYATCFYELLRFVGSVLGVGTMSDLIFSPLHRAMHHPAVYKDIHKEHHAFQDDLTSLVIWHGTILEDILMPATTIIGSFFYSLLVFSVLGVNPVSNFTKYLSLCNVMFSHAHDHRLASLIVPLPEDLNFAAYHRRHHLNPAKNFGLTKPSDIFWDTVLGTDTILEPKKAE